MIDHDSLELRISVGEGNLGKVKNKTTTWGKLRKKCATPSLDAHHTLDQYNALPVEEQNRLKNTGFFVGGWCDKGIRQASYIQERTMVYLDIDKSEPEILDAITCGLNNLSGYEFFSYSTRRHTPECPRIRILIPLTHAVPSEHYQALSRILASKLDRSMEGIDPVSFRVAQVMYWPSVCKGAEFFQYHNRGEICDPDAVLEAFGDWQDYTKLPKSERDDTLRAHTSKKAEDPKTKKGLVGAFCRVYDVPRAIATFIPDKYEPGTEISNKPRYSYTGGSTANGAIVEDNGDFLYSYHTHDPCSMRLVNSFDLVRIHLFGDRDSDAKEGTRQTELPSYNAMKEMLAGDEAITAQLRDSKYDFDAIANGTFENLDELEGEEDWFKKLELTEDGVIKPSLNNIVSILMNDPRFKGSCRFNEFRSNLSYCRQIDLSQFGLDPIRVFDSQNGDTWTDNIDAAVRYVLEYPRGKGKPGFGMQVTDRNLIAAVTVAADQNKFHPVREYLNSITWDGKRRMDGLFVDYVGAQDTPYHREAAKIFMLAAVTRVFEPGHKFDYVPILEGVQGKQKSTFVEVLAKGWFGELKHAVDDNNRAIESMQGCWIMEIPELSQFRKAEVQALKAFFSAKEDKARLAFERRPKIFKRQCIFIGTTNEREYLRDSTGGRRFWPVSCEVERIDVDRLRRNIDQMWAEATHAYRELRKHQPFGVLPLYLANDEVSAEATMMQESRREESLEDALVGQIMAWVNKPCHTEDAAGARALPDYGAVAYTGGLGLRNVICGLEVFEKCLKRDIRYYTRREQLDVAKAMSMLPGWKRIGIKKYHGDYGRQIVHMREGQSGCWTPIDMESL